MNFVAPEARILVIDDNKMSLKLASNLVAAFGAQVDGAESGAVALGLLEQKCYHLILMDYMMPIMDGMEVTRCIRGMEDRYYHEVPIIALTGEDVLEEDVFLKAGMNGFLHKPLEKKRLEEILCLWLPKQLIISPNSACGMEEAEAWTDLELQGIDAVQGIRNSGGKEHFISFLGDFYKLIDTKSDKLEKCMADKQIKEYTIEVHALKNTARIIGAMELAEGFQRMELLGKAQDAETIVQELPGLLARYRSYKAILKPYGVREDAGCKDTSVDEIIFYLRGLQEATEAFDMDRVDEAMAKLEELRMPEACATLMNKLRVAVADVAMENILVMSEEMISFFEITS